MIRKRKENTSDRNKDPQEVADVSWGEYEFGSFIQKKVSVCLLMWALWLQ